MESIFVEDRKKVIVKGANKMVSSAPTEAVVETNGTNLIVTGSELEITNLNLQDKEVWISGIITSIRYATKKEKVGLLKRIFK